MLTLLDVGVCVAALALLRWVHTRRARGSASGLSHPPGPPGRALIGNLLDLPKQPAWLAYQRWSREYGESLCIRANAIVLVCSHNGGQARTSSG